MTHYVEQIRQHCRDNVGHSQEPDVTFFQCELDSLADVKRVGDAIYHQESQMDIVRIPLLSISTSARLPAILPACRSYAPLR